MVGGFDPNEVLSRHGIVYRIRSKIGKEMVVHHDNLTLCVVPISKGVRIAPAPMDIRFAEGGATTNRMELNPRQNNQQLPRPARLRQNIQPPLRFGDFVTH